MSDIASTILMIFGTGLILTASLGMLRLPDLYLRTSASTKAATLGLGCILIAVAIHFNDLGISSRALATLAFILLTAPVAAHMIGRAAYIYKIPLWSGTVVDELKGRYDAETHVLAGFQDPADSIAQERQLS